MNCFSNKDFRHLGKRKPMDEPFGVFKNKEYVVCDGILNKFKDNLEFTK